MLDQLNMTRIVAVSQTDFDRLSKLLDSEWTLAIGGQRPHLELLKQKLQEADVVESSEMSPDIVTMNSTLYLKDVNRRETDIYTLVYPDEACISEGKLSILSPLGSELFGRRVGEVIHFKVGEKELHKRVEKLSFQPERVGAFEL